MPNYSKAEQKLLSEKDRALTTRSRGSDLTQMVDAALMKLIAELDAARKDAGQPGGPGNRNRYDLLNAALRRCNDERRARGLKPDGSKQSKEKPGGKPAVAAGAAPAATAAKARNLAKRTGSPRNKDGQPLDKRTGPRRIPKAKAAAATAPVPLATVAPAPTAIAATTPTAVDKPAKAPKPDKAAIKAQRKADKQAAKEAEKAARKAERKAAKEAEKAARKAERQAARKAEKQAAKGKKGKGA
ncbi:MAG: hypothetical protein Q4G22_11790 [Paracoccus sp. (in: a-proteobacteria)]|uniref:hypothetical protein n=1 Tax=Paracoccus sp. TaxID=267 RepID=UPI0026DF0394|nr:hypothetical protein [Paracoccus sp. (in: a-proteobacteria)]MDO5632504.1 hypothetical protein [Paracoccus sp. (in: a-proteobacteria)]